ncbi:aldehyde dehydrogenase family protein, partial [Novosphingobium sp.]|uniref:aldehyde dehydrogenase family protein n=1 Tax=Novosphingobium sp. TaxID=1874826 RepID=UPI002600DB80
MIDGSILIGGEARRNAQTFRATNPATGEASGPEFCEASGQDVVDACALAAAALPAFSALSPDARAAFLDACAEAILAIGDTLVETAMAESGLP